MKVLMIVQEPVVTRRIVQEARSLTDAGHCVRILTRSDDTQDRHGEIEGIPATWVAVTGRDRRFRWLYKLAGIERGSQVAALWGVITGRHTFTQRALPYAIEAHAEVYHAHDLNNLEVAYRAARANGAKLVYDSHELFPDIANRWIRMRRKGWMRLERRLLPHADLVITVNDFIAQELAKRHAVPPPMVLLNCPNPPADFDASANHNHIRVRLGLEDTRPIVLYQGWMWEGRGLENLVRAASKLARNAAVVLMGYGEYQAVLEEMAQGEPPGRVYFLPAVPQRDLLAYCASADVGVIPYQAVDLNNYYSSPNKLFDYIQAALPIVASDLPFLRKVIVTDGLGTVSKLDSPESYAEAINQVLTLPDGGEEFKRNLRRVAPQYTWEAQARKLVEAYRRLGVRGYGSGNS
jgi:glycosyltransferase involved in cell wall biosynthesis